MKLDLVKISSILSFLYLILLLYPELAMCAPRKTMAAEDYSVPDTSQNMKPVFPLHSTTPNPASQPHHAFTKSFSGSLLDFIKGNLPGNVLTLPQSSKSAPPPNSPMTPNPDLKKICASTDYPQICLSTISPFFSRHGSVDAGEVLKMAMRACNKQINATIGLAKEQLISKEVDADVIKTCKDQYSDALDNLKNALDAYRSRDIGTLQSMLSTVISDVSTCSDELRGKKSALKVHDSLISNMASNCLAIASLVES